MGIPRRRGPGNAPRWFKESFPAPYTPQLYTSNFTDAVLSFVGSLGRAIQRSIIDPVLSFTGQFNVQSGNFIITFTRVV